ncbi:MAG: TPM domain-containing protein [Bacteroidota bacterium]
MKRFLNLYLNLNLLFLPSLLLAQGVPFLSGRVNDYAGVLSTQTRNDLEAMLKEQESTTSNQIVVLTIQSLEGAVLEEYSLKVAETWKLGQKEKNNGVLLLISKDDRKLRIEVGYGLEGSLTDATCNSIIRKEIVPHFKDGNYDAGITAGVKAIIEAVKGEYVAEESDSGSGDGGMDITGTLFFVGVFLLVVGTHSVIAILNKGFMSYFHGAFLLPFWTLFPRAFLGSGVGFIPVIFFVIIFIAAKLWFKTNPSGQAFQTKWMPRGGHSGSSGGGWSSGGGGGFSGGGGSFGGGGSSGSW